MGSFQRSFLGYRRPEVDAAITARDTQMSAKDARIAELSQELLSKAEVEEELSSLSGMVIEREREIRGLNDQLREANERHDRSIASLESVSARLHEIEAQARGQATRIRMKALREAVEVGRRAQELSDAEEMPAPPIEEVRESPAGQAQAVDPGLNGHAETPNGQGEISQETFEGTIRIEVGPLGDYSQLVGIEDAIGRLGGSEISIERFSEGRATLSMNLDEPIDLLRELEEHSPLDFRVRRAVDDNLVLDVDDDDPDHRVA